MNPSQLALVLLFAATASTLLACIGEVMASRQMALSCYRYVPLVRALRLASWAAQAYVFSFALVALMNAPLATALALCCAGVLGLVVEARTLDLYGDVVGASRRALTPAVVVLVTLTNVFDSSLPFATHLNLGVPALVMAVLVAIGLRFVDYHRGIQDWLRLRD